MRIILIGPLGFSEKMYFSPPLGIHRIGSFLKNKGYSCTVVDPTIEDIPDLTNYDLIGYSILGYTLENTIKHINGLNLTSGQRVVAGGMEATFNFKELAKACPTLHAIVLGEGEFPMLHLASHEAPAAHPGVAYVQDGKVMSAPQAIPLNKKDFCEFTVDTDYEAIPYEEYWRRVEKNAKNGFNSYETKVIRLYLKNRCSFKCNF